MALWKAMVNNQESSRLCQALKSILVVSINTLSAMKWIISYLRKDLAKTITRIKARRYWRKKGKSYLENEDIDKPVLEYTTNNYPSYKNISYYSSRVKCIELEFSLRDRRIKAITIALDS